MNQSEEMKSKINELNAELVSYANAPEFDKICDFILDTCLDCVPWTEIYK